jgi:hypothetical protein
MSMGLGVLGSGRVGSESARTATMKGPEGSKAAGFTKSPLWLCSGSRPFFGNRSFEIA